jgi:hypothetical protein
MTFTVPPANFWVTRGDVRTMAFFDDDGLTINPTSIAVAITMTASRFALLLTVLSSAPCSYAFFTPLAAALTRLTPLMMFTGIVEEMGTIVSLEERDDMPLWDGSKGKGTELVVEANVVMEGAYLG